MRSKILLHDLAGAVRQCQLLDSGGRHSADKPRHEDQDLKRATNHAIALAHALIAALQADYPRGE